MATPLDTAFLVMTAAWGLAFIAYASWRVGRKTSAKDVLWMLAILALTAIGILILFPDLVGSQLRYEPMIGMMVPGLFAAGVLATYFRKNGGALYTIYVLLVLAAYIDLKDTGGPYFWALMAVHVPGSLIIIVGSGLAATRGSGGLLLTAAGGLLVSFYGVALAAADLGVQLLPSSMMTALTAPMLFFTMALLTAGLMAAGLWKTAG
jgi:hypothetical protein